MMALEYLRLCNCGEPNLLKTCQILNSYKGMFCGGKSTTFQTNGIKGLRYFIDFIDNRLKMD